MAAKAGGWFREIKADDSFGRIARSHASFSRQSAIDRATAELARIRPRITAYIREECRRLDAALLAANKRNEDCGASLAEAYSASQNLRDVADTVGYSLIGLVATNFCTIVETADAAHMDCPAAIIECYLDALRLVQTAPYRAKPLSELSDFSTALLQTVQWIKMKADRRPAGGNAP